MNFDNLADDVIALYENARSISGSWSFFSKASLDIPQIFTWKIGSFVCTIDYECLFNLIKYGLIWNWNFLNTGNFLSSQYFSTVWNMSKNFYLINSIYWCQNHLIFTLFESSNLPIIIFSLEISRFYNSQA